MTTAAYTDAPARPTTRRQDRTRAALAERARRAATVASAARRRYRRPALVTSSFGCGIAAAWTTFGLGAGLLALAAALFVLEYLGDDDSGDT